MRIKGVFRHNSLFWPVFIKKVVVSDDTKKGNRHDLPFEGRERAEKLSMKDRFRVAIVSDRAKTLPP